MLSISSLLVDAPATLAPPSHCPRTDQAFDQRLSLVSFFSLQDLIASDCCWSTFMSDKDVLLYVRSAWETEMVEVGSYGTALQPPGINYVRSA